MSFLADICKCAREQVRLELDFMAVAVPGGGAFGPCPQRPITGDQHICCPPPPNRSLDPLGPLAEVYFYQVSGPCGTDRAPQAGLYRTNPGPADGPARWIRAPQDGSGPHGTSRAPQDGWWPAGRSRAPQDESGPRRMNQDYSGPHVTGHGPSGRSRDPKPHILFFLVGQIWGVFSFRGYPRHGPFSRLAPPKGKSCDRPWDSMVYDVLLPRSNEVNMGMSMNAWRNKTFFGFGSPGVI